jgi:hypothetical protein
MSLPAWVEKLTSKNDLGCGDIDNLMTALSIAWEALENFKGPTNEGIALEALRRIEELGKER